MKSKFYLSFLALAAAGIAHGQVMIEDFEEPGSLVSWQNSTAGVYSIEASDDAVEGTTSANLIYDLVADQGWGGTVEILLQPANAPLDMSDQAGVEIDYKVPVPASNSETVVILLKLITPDGTYEFWAGDLPDDDSGEWQTVQVPFGDFNGPGAPLDLTNINEAVITLLAFTDGTQAAGEILLDDFKSYAEGDPGPVDEIEEGDVVHSFDDATQLYFWTVSDAGSIELNTSMESVQGEGAVCIDYNLVADQGWGGALAMGSTPENEAATFPDVTGADGLKLSYKVEEVPAGAINLTFKMKLANDEIWKYDSGPGIFLDESGEWQELLMPVDEFVLDSDPVDNVFDLANMVELTFDMWSGTPDDVADGLICVDNLVSYNILSNTIAERPETVNVYPNPTTDFLSINIENEIDRIEIYNITGVLVKSVVLSAGDKLISVADLSTGLYMIQAFGGSNVYASKFVKK